MKNLTITINDSLYPHADYPYFDCLEAGIAFEGQEFRSEGAQEARRIEDLTGCKNSDSISGAIKNTLNGFDDKRRREGVDVTTTRDQATCFPSLSNYHVYEEDLRGTSRLVGRFGRRRSGIAKIAQRRQVEMGMKTGHLQMAADHDSFC